MPQPLKPLFACHSVFLVELLNTSVYPGTFLLAGIERMALAADLDVELRLRRPRYKCISAVAGHGRLLVIGMYSFSHDITSYNIIISYVLMYGCRKTCGQLTNNNIPDTVMQAFYKIRIFLTIWTKS